jgi:hypothetical protein
VQGFCFFEFDEHGKDRYPGPAVKPKLRDAMVGVSPRNSPSHPYATRSHHSRRSKDARTWRPPRQTLTRATSGCSHADSYVGKGAESSVEDCPAGRLAFVPKEAGMEIGAISSYIFLSIVEPFGCI